MDQEKRIEISALPFPEQRKWFKTQNYKCELCDKKAKYVVPRALVLCCVFRPDRCMNPNLSGHVCYGCGKPATRLTKTGPVCGTHPQTGCQALTDAFQKQKGETFSKHIASDPAFRESVKQKHRQSLLDRHGVTSVNQLPTWKAAILDKYGVENPAQSQVVKDLKIKNSLERHGVEHPSMLESTKLANRKTCQERYGVDNVSQSKELEAKWRAEHLARTGVDHPTKTQAWKDNYMKTMSGRWAEHWGKSKLALQQRYGVDNMMLAPNALDNRKQTCIDRFGVEHAAQAPELIAKREQSNLTKYGHRYPIQDPHTYRKSYLPNFYLKKKMVLPSGRQIWYQGYEDRSIQYWLSKVPEEDIAFGGETFVPYGEGRTYYPDLLIKSRNHLIETKSPYTLYIGLRDTLLEKVEAAEMAGYTITVECWVEGEDLLLFSVPQLSALNQLARSLEEPDFRDHICQ